MTATYQPHDAVDMTHALKNIAMCRQAPHRVQLSQGLEHPDQLLQWAQDAFVLRTGLSEI